MHFISDRQRKSKIYLPNSQSIPLSKDAEHQLVNDKKLVEPKSIQQKKKIDKIMTNLIKQRMFGNFLSEDTKISVDNYYTLDIMNKQYFANGSRSKSRIDHSMSKKQYSIDMPHFKGRSCSKQHDYLTIDTSRSVQNQMDQFKVQAAKRRSFTRKLPTLVGNMVQNSNAMKKKMEYGHQKKLDINEKVTGEKFKKWAGGLSGIQTMYDLKVSRETIANNFKSAVNPKILERFFHFFGFPQSFGLRQYCNLVENAINCSMKFIYFWVFALFDQNCNGILQSQDLFQFIQNFYIENYYIQQEVYRIARYLNKIEKNFKPREQKQLVEETLIVNHNLKIDQLKDLMKESEKERIDVECVKNTCYHQTVMSLEHDPIERIKQHKMEANQLETKRLKEEMIEVKKKLQNTPGLRLRDFYIIFGGEKRPRIFCYFVSLLTGKSGSDFQ